MSFTTEEINLFEREIDRYFLKKKFTLDELIIKVKEDNNKPLLRYLFNIKNMRERFERDQIIGKMLFESLKEEDPYQQIVTTENKIHKQNLFYPFKFINEIDSSLTKFKKNIIYDTDVMVSKENSIQNIFSFARPYLNKIIKFYKKFSFNNYPVIKGKYYLFIDQNNKIIASYMITMDHKNNKILNYKKKDGEIKKESLYYLRIAVDIYINLNKKDYKTEEVCAICYDNKPNIIFKPCGHTSICKSCYNLGKINTCPMCRTKLTHALHCDILL